MHGDSRRHKKLYQYYRCPATHSTLDYARTCSAPGFRVREVDAAVWAWVKSFLTDPTMLAKGLEEYQEEQTKETAPLRERLSVVDGLQADNLGQLERLVDLYIAGELPKEMLIERKRRLEKTIGALERERVDLNARLKAQTLTSEQIMDLHDFAAGVMDGLGLAGDDFETRRRIIEKLDVQVTLTAEDGQKVAYASCMVGEQVLSVASNSTQPSPTRTSFVPFQRGKTP